MIINERDTLETWLDQNYWFEDGYISNIETDANGIQITIGFQLEGNYVAGEPQILKEYTITPNEIVTWTYDSNVHQLEELKCIESINLTDTGLGLRFETSPAIELICKSFYINDAKIINTQTKPWISEREFSFSYESDELPHADFWIDAFKNFGIQMSFRIYADQERERNRIPYPDYSGLFLQRTDRLLISNKGIFFSSVTTNDKLINYTFELDDENLSEEWMLLQKLIANWPQLKVTCGNVTFIGIEWKNYIDSRILPRDLNEQKNVC